MSRGPSLKLLFEINVQTNSTCVSGEGWEKVVRYEAASLFRISSHFLGQWELCLFEKPASSACLCCPCGQGRRPGRVWAASFLNPSISLFNPSLQTLWLLARLLYTHTHTHTNHHTSFYPWAVAGPSPPWRRESPAFLTHPGGLHFLPPTPTPKPSQHNARVSTTSFCPVGSFLCFPMCQFLLDPELFTQKASIWFSFESPVPSPGI